MSRAAGASALPFVPAGTAVAPGVAPGTAPDGAPAFDAVFQQLTGALITTAVGGGQAAAAAPVVAGGPGATGDAPSMDDTGTGIGPLPSVLAAPWPMMLPPVPPGETPTPGDVEVSPEGESTGIGVGLGSGGGGTAVGPVAMTPVPADQIGPMSLPPEAIAGTPPEPGSLEMLPPAPAGTIETIDASPEPAADAVVEPWGGPRRLPAEPPVSAPATTTSAVQSHEIGPRPAVAPGTAPAAAHGAASVAASAPMSVPAPASGATPFVAPESLPAVEPPVTPSEAPAPSVVPGAAPRAAALHRALARRESAEHGEMAPAGLAAQASRMPAAGGPGAQTSSDGQAPSNPQPRAFADGPPAARGIVRGAAAQAAPSNVPDTAGGATASAGPHPSAAQGTSGRTAWHAAAAAARLGEAAAAVDVPRQPAGLSSLPPLPAPAVEPVLLRDVRPAMVDAPVRLPAETAAPDVHAQIVKSMRLQWSGGAGEARVTLKPEYLGEVVAKITVDQGVVTATLHADTADVRRVLESQTATLRDALVEHGLRLDKVVVAEPETTPGQGDRRQRGRQPQPPPARPKRRGQDTGATFAFPTE